MATKITNVYVKNKAAGETSFTEVDSVYVGDTRVFQKAKWVAATTPEGIIPLKSLSNTVGQYGPYRSLCTQEEMDKVNTTCFGFLLTPVGLDGGLYVPYWDHDNDTGITIHIRSGNYNMTGSSSVSILHMDHIGDSSDKQYIYASNYIRKEGSALFSPTLTTTLYLKTYNGFTSSRRQDAYLINRVGPPFTINIWGVYVKYKYWGGTDTGRPYITVAVGPKFQDPPAGYPPQIVRSSRNGSGTALTGTSNLFVN